MLIVETTYNEEDKLWKGAENLEYLDPQTPIGDVVLEALKEHATKPFEVVEDTQHQWNSEYNRFLP